jgi:hypothetical protein
MKRRRKRSRRRADVLKTNIMFEATENGEK